MHNRNRTPHNGRDTMPLPVDPRQFTTDLAETDNDLDDAPPAPGCPCCRFGRGVRLGCLANRNWWRCRSCGIDLSTFVSPEEGESE